MAGLHPQCLPWLHEREVALLMGDGISDMTPGLGIANWPFPMHQIGITGMGLHLVDNVNLAPSGAGVRRAAAVGVPVRGRTAAHPRRHRLSGEPARDLLTTDRTSPPIFTAARTSW